MNNKTKDWLQDEYYKSYEAIGKIASIVQNYN